MEPPDQCARSRPFSQLAASFIGPAPNACQRRRLGCHLASPARCSRRRRGHEHFLHKDRHRRHLMPLRQHQKVIVVLRNGKPIPSFLRMDRIFLIVICSSIVLLTTALGLASPPAGGVQRADQIPLLLRTIPPRSGSASTRYFRSDKQFNGHGVKRTKGCSVRVGGTETTSPEPHR